MIKPWERSSSEHCGDYRIFRVRRDKSISPRSGKEHDFFILETAEWVNVIPVTSDGQIVLIRQYRHGTRAVELEIPGGLVEAGEAPAVAGRREMREETGYDTETIVHLGTIAPNPAIQNNRCHYYLAANARYEGSQALDSGEDIEVLLVDQEDIPALIAEGKIRHGIMVAAFYYLELHRIDAGA